MATIRRCIYEILQRARMEAAGSDRSDDYVVDKPVTADASTDNSFWVGYCSLVKFVDNGPGVPDNGETTRRHGNSRAVDCTNAWASGFRPCWSSVRAGDSAGCGRLTEGLRVGDRASTSSGLC
jgi:hypothetical protein